VRSISSSRAGISIRGLHRLTFRFDIRGNCSSLTKTVGLAIRDDMSRCQFAADDRDQG
jgi:hypothetical protein